MVKRLLFGEIEETAGGWKGQADRKNNSATGSLASTLGRSEAAGGPSLGETRTIANQQQRSATPSSTGSTGSTPRPFMDLVIRKKWRGNRSLHPSERAALRVHQVPPIGSESIIE
jgi:hypothetical protein